MPGRPCGADFHNFWRVVSYLRRNHPCQISSRSVKGFGLYGYPNSGVSHWLWSSPLQQCYALPCYTVMTSYQKSEFVNRCVFTLKYYRARFHLHRVWNDKALLSSHSKRGSGGKLVGAYNREQYGYDITYIGVNLSRQKCIARHGNVGLEVHGSSFFFPYWLHSS